MVSNGDRVVAQADELDRGNRGGWGGTGFKHGCSDGKRHDDAVNYRDMTGVTSLWKDSEEHLSVRPSVCLSLFSIFIPVPIPWTRNATHLRRATDMHMCGKLQRNAEMTASDAPYVTLLKPGGGGRGKRQFAISAIGVFSDGQKSPRGEVEHAITT